MQIYMMRGINKVATPRHNELECENMENQQYGMGWLPYEYVRKETALDFWSLLSQAWIDTGIFKI